MDLEHWGGKNPYYDMEMAPEEYLNDTTILLFLHFHTHSPSPVEEGEDELRKDHHNIDNQDHDDFLLQ